MNDSVLALIPARGGSRRAPGKNLAPVAGRPLIAWTIEAALQAACIDHVIVDTDDAAIADAARQWGARTPYARPPELARDDTPSMAVVLHALRRLDEQERYRPHWLCLLQPTSPLRTAADIDAAMQLALDRRADSVVSVTASDHDARWFKHLDDDGRLRDATIPPGLRPARLNGAIYLARRDLLLQQQTWYGERAFGYAMPEARSLDIDEPWQLRVAEAMLSRPGPSGTQS